MANIVVIGATGDVGHGIVAVLLDRGHRVAAVARTEARLRALHAELGAPERLHVVPGSLGSDAEADRARDAAGAALPALDGVVVAVNAPRRRAALASLASPEFRDAIGADLVTHFAAVRAFAPALAPGGVYVGIGGGAADFVLAGAAHLSVAQAGLRMLYRALAHELGPGGVELKELIVASVVNGASTRHGADPAWVTDREIGAQVAAMIEDPGAFPAPIWRIGRRGADGRPVVTAEAPTTVAERPLVAADLPPRGAD